METDGGERAEQPPERFLRLRGGEGQETSMAIFINKKPKTVENAIKLIPKPDKHKKQIVTAWHKSKTNHCFNDEKKKKTKKRASELFKEAVRKNRKTLKSREKIDKLFTPSNYCFSTKACNREETLYFGDCAAKQTGRLRQQHSHGPLAKIDKNARTHLFLSEKRFESLKKWRTRHKRCFPSFCCDELQPEIGKRHLEFAWDGKKVVWHASDGKVTTVKRNLKSRIDCALKEILGWDEVRGGGG